MLRQIISRAERLLNNNKVQRLGYTTALIIWLLIWQRRFKYYNMTSSFGIKYIWSISVPAIILFVQIIFNKKFLWATIFGIVLTYSVYATYVNLTDIIKRSGNNVKAISWDLKNLLLLILSYVILFLINWTICKLKPTATTRYTA